jgi:hypothetical protein
MSRPRAVCTITKTVSFPLIVLDLRATKAFEGLFRDNLHVESLFVAPEWRSMNSNKFGVPLPYYSSSPQLHRRLAGAGLDGPENIGPETVLLVCGNRVFPRFPGRAVFRTRPR